MWRNIGIIILFQNLFCVLLCYNFSILWSFLFRFGTSFSICIKGLVYCAVFFYSMTLFNTMELVVLSFDSVLFYKFVCLIIFGCTFDTGAEFHTHIRALSICTHARTHARSLTHSLTNL
jgi:hypothetical protein